ncbi:MAG TPA: DUF58 domain-containing protein [Candidatus Saccharimonadales bacterium]|nr:DUF58 domain-containing protein [Candidatus Saccharimonadales bacterium]
MLRRLDGLLQGEYRSLFRGNGLDLADIREYEPGDDVRYIDWNVSARMDATYVRQYLEDREVTAHFLLDLSPSVDFGTVTTLKRDQLVDLVALLARLLARHGNKIGATLYGGKVERVIPAAGGRVQTLRILNDILQLPRLASAPYTSVSDLLEHAVRTIRRRSVIFLVSDFFTAPGWERPLGMLARRHEVIAVRLTDPRERELPDIGFVVLSDAETGETLHVDTHDLKFRARFEAAARTREAELAAAFARCGVDVLTLSTEEELVRAVVRFAALRRRRRGMRAAG